MAELPLLLLQGAELSQEEEEGKVVAVPPVPRAAPNLRVVDHCSVEGLVDPPRDLVRPVQDTRSVGSTLASEATQEQKEACVRDTSKTSVTQGGVSFDSPYRYHFSEGFCSKGDKCDHAHVQITQKPRRNKSKRKHSPHTKKSVLFSDKE